MVCAFIVMKCEGFSQITDLADYLDSNRFIAHYCSFNIMKSLPSYWTYNRFLSAGGLHLPLYELTTPANVADSTVVEEILAAGSTLSIQECTFLGDKGYDVKAVLILFMSNRGASAGCNQ